MLHRFKNSLSKKIKFIPNENDKNEFRKQAVLCAQSEQIRSAERKLPIPVVKSKPWVPAKRHGKLDGIGKSQKTKSALDLIRLKMRMSKQR